MPAGVSVWRGVARLVMPSLVRQGLGSNAIINVLQGLGLSYRRTVMLGDIREFSGLARLERVVMSVASDVLFPQHAMVETSLRRARPYRVFGRLTVEDTTTHEQFERFVSFYADERDSKAGWSEAYVEQWQETESGRLMRAMKMQIASVEHQQGWSF